MSENSSIKALKSGMWYIVANFVTKSMVFLSTPIFSRMLTHEEYGLYSNYTSWLSTFMVFMTLNIGSTFISAKYDFKSEFDSYISSAACLSILSCVFWTIIINLFSNKVVSLTGVNIEHLNIMLMYILATAIIEMFQTRERYNYEYKKSVYLSMLISVGSTLLSVTMVYLMQDKLQGRILGNSIISVIIGIILGIYIFYKGRSINVKFWRYALPICLPYIPHLMSLTILNSVDKIMITKISGPDDNALYSLAYSCGAVITLLILSMNTAFSPWLGEKLETGSIDEIYKFSSIYVKIFTFLSCGMMLISPEILYLMGGKGYSGSLFVMPPVAYGFVCQFMYTMFVNIEQFKKKTLGMAIASASAALINYILNALLIPKYGYVAAAYTTLVSFIWLLLVHIYLVKRIGFIKAYNIKTMFIALGVTGVFTIVVNYLYLYPIIRYLVIGLYIMILFLIIKKNHKIIIKLLRR